MQYYIFQINAFQQLKLLDTVADYRAARQQLRQLRKATSVPPGTTYRLMFADDEDEAQRLLTTKREPRPMGEYD